MKDPAAEEKAQQLAELTAAFCDQRLNAEYKKLSRKVIDKMSRKRPNPLLRGRPEIWAAGVIHAVGYVNFLFDKSFKPYVSFPDLCAHFGVSQSSATLKSKQIRDALGMDRFNVEYATKKTKEQIAHIDEIFRQAQQTLFPGMNPVSLSTPNPGEGEFIDIRPHPGMEAYYDLCERFPRDSRTETFQTQLRQLIQADPDYYDPYLMLADLLRREGKGEEADEVLNEAFERAVHRITDDRGEWPKKMEWGWIENRHVIRTVLNKAIALWNRGSLDGAAELFRKLLRSDPEDGAGARNYLLAVRMGKTFEGFEREFMLPSGFYDGMKLITWFEDNIDRFPEEFGGWKEAVGWEE